MLGFLVVRMQRRIFLSGFSNRSKGSTTMTMAQGHGNEYFSVVMDKVKPAPLWKQRKWCFGGSFWRRRFVCSMVHKPWRIFHNVWGALYFWWTFIIDLSPFRKLKNNLGILINNFNGLCIGVMDGNYKRKMKQRKLKMREMLVLNWKNKKVLKILVYYFENIAGKTMFILNGCNYIMY